MLDGMVNDAVEARALSLNPNHIDIYSASWGPEDDGKTVDGPGPLAKKAFFNGITSGRNGLGSIFVWASGNGGRQTDNCNCDGYTNSIYTLSISSATQGGRKPWYLEECSSTLATTYSSGTPGQDASITTVDQDMRLRPNMICTSAHTGTSASAPIAAGICALALQANPNLSWRDMQYIVVQTANPEPLLHEVGWAVNGAGRKFSHKFGYGLMDAAAMVDVALNWPGVSAQKECSSPLLAPNMNLAKQANDVVQVAVAIDGCKNTQESISVLEHVVCKVSLKHNPRGSVHMVLISPMGTRSSLLLPRPRDKTDSGFDNWPFLSVHFWGEPPNGTWTLELTQNEGNTRRPGVLKSWQLILYGTADLSPLAVPQEDEESMIDNHDLVLEPEDAEHSGQEVAVNLIPLDVAPHIDGCHPECLNGCKMGDPDACNACQHFNFSGHCVLACPAGSFPTPDNRCELCNKNCQTCYGPLTNQCLTCNSHKLLTSHDTSCVKECPRGWRPNKEATACEPCPNNCANCNDLDECENCLAGLYLTSDTRTCVAVCPEGHFMDKASRTCQPCHPDCETCTGPRDSQCSRCKKGSFYFQRKCTKEGCPKGYFADLYITECAPCPKGCRSCLGHDSCEVCEAGWSLINGKHCMPSLASKCTHGGTYFANHSGTCEECHLSCASCFSGAKEGCLSCHPGQLLHINSCLDGSCPDSTFQSNNECRHCAHACSKCSSLQKCDTCHSGYYLTSTGHCVPACPPGEYPSQTDGCQLCPSACLDCVNATTCSVCKDKTPLLTSDGGCLDRCPLGTFKGAHNRCLPCHGSCYSCTGPGKNDCTSCPQGTRLHDYTCESCSLGSYYDSSTSNCQKCHSTCRSCTGPLQSDCLSCANSDLHLDENHTCVSCCSKSESNNSSCCHCDEQNKACTEHVNGNKKRSSSKEFATTRYLDAFVVFSTMTALTFVAIVAYRKWKRMRRLPRAKWRRVRTSNPENNPDSGCEILTNNDDDDDSEDEIELSTQQYTFGDERRRLLKTVHNGNVSPVEA